MTTPHIDKVVLTCPNEACKQQLAVPYTSRTLQVTCPKCGTHFTFDGSAQAHVSQPAEEKASRRRAVSQKRPWVRWFARTMDMVGFSFLFGFVLAFAYPAAFDLPDWALGLAFLFAWVFVEAMLLASFGATPGKWLLKTRVIGEDGEPPSFPKALRRSFGVWWRGLGLGLPLISLITQIAAYSKLKKEGVASWDRVCGLVVSHKRIGFPRVLLTVVGLVGLAYLVASFRYGPMSPEDQLRHLIAEGEGEVRLACLPRRSLQAFWESLAERTFSARAWRSKRSLTTVEVSRECRPAVVSIVGLTRDGETLGEGSGVLVSAEGAVLTNRHVVCRSQKLSIESQGGWVCDSWRVLADLPSIDVVLLSPVTPPMQPLPRMSVGDSDALEQGETVIAIGNPWGFEHTVTDGIVSGFRELGGADPTRVIQITAPISPGSSGGGLVNMRGELVGITQGSVGGEWAQNLNFAIPTCEILRRIQKAAEEDDMIP
jgi:S1-C subfamily serine protease/uncharacterized RDD family membrane protein YckC